MFNTGATRDSDDDKLDYEGFLSPLVLEAYAKYMHEKRRMPDGSMRASDNWQLGIPTDAYMKSQWRHFFDVWKNHRGLPAQDDLKTALLALRFNVDGYLHEVLKAEQPTSAFPAPDTRGRTSVFPPDSGIGIHNMLPDNDPPLLQACPEEWEGISTERF